MAPGMLVLGFFVFLPSNFAGLHSNDFAGPVYSNGLRGDNPFAVRPRFGFFLFLGKFLN